VKASIIIEDYTLFLQLLSTYLSPIPAPKIMLPMLFCWPMISEAYVIDMAVEVETSHKYPVTFSCVMIHTRRRAVWKNGIWHGGAYEVKVYYWMGNKMALSDIHWCLLNVYGDQTVDVSTVRQWVLHLRTGNNGLPSLMQIFTSAACRHLFIVG